MAIRAPDGANKDKDRGIGSDLVTFVTQLTFPDKLRNSNHGIEG